MKSLAITVRFFGAFREYGRSIDLSLPAGSTVCDVRQALGDALSLSDPALVYDSVFSDDQVILDDGAVLSDNALLSILPPVCGG